MYNWESSIFLHRCKNCGRWIKPRINHIVKYGWDVERYCDPICARERRKKMEQEQRDELSRMIYGGEE